MTQKEIIDRLFDLTIKKNRAKRKIKKFTQKRIELQAQIVELQKQCSHPNKRIKEYVNNCCLSKCIDCDYEFWEEC